MLLSEGSWLGQYEIQAPLGAGGMGEVYRARDTRLGREVAIKVLSDALAGDPEHLARFQREARLLAALSHPSIAVIHGMEEAGKTRFLVLELVPGETLADRVAGGPLPMNEALEICRQIAEALEAAHGKGIVHRDLKPGNVKVTPEGRVKVLDFGLARSLAAAISPEESSAPTAIAPQTRAGTILGTPSYMSPEQARGRPVDKRADIWAFGCVLYEMLTGARAFEGETSLDTLAAILNHEPDWRRLPRGTPQEVRKLLERCLEKDPSQRLRDAGDAGLEIQTALSARKEEGPASRRVGPSAPARIPRWSDLARSITSLLSTTRVRPESSAPFSPPRLSQVTFAESIEEFPAWSPDGKRLAFCREAGAIRKVFSKDLATGQESALTRGESDDIQPDWSADGRFLLFMRSRQPGRKLEPMDVFGAYEGADIWSLDVSTGKEALLVENAANPSHSPDGKRIAFDASWAGPRRIWIADERGHNPQQATSDASEALAHTRPRWSPDGSRIIFQNIERTKFDLRVVDLASNALSWVTNDYVQDIWPVWSPSGFVYFTSYRGGGLNIWRVAVTARGEPVGPLQQLTTGAGQDVGVAISRDGRKLAFSILRQNAHIWRLPVSPAAGRPAGSPEKVIATTREDSRGAWSRDGKEIVFNSDRSGEMNVWLLSTADGAVRQVTHGPGGDFQPSFSADRKRIVFFSSRSGSVDIWLVESAGGKPRRLTQGPSISVNPVFSPDGRSIAYMSDEGGRLEVWLMNADGSQPRPLTQVGVMGHFLQWTADGEWIVFRCPSGKPRTMRVRASGGEPEEMPEVVGGAHMSFSPDETRIMDVLGHKTLWVSPLTGGAPEKVFEFDDPDSRIDYPRWSPDGRFVLFDRFRPSGGDVWMMEKFE
ncbi:MAG TPA: protein kinase [Thermoanaerobaculia bacterium]|nr:protein kinase [Thermoanaerobaculia bacterium]